MTKKKSKAVKTEAKEYTVLIPVTSHETGESFKPGDVVTADDFPAAVIDNWLGITPAVLEIKEKEEVE